MANTRTDSEAVIKLVINGQQANASIKELTDTQRKLNAEIRNMKPADPGYKKALEELQKVSRATTELRNQQRGLGTEVTSLKASWSSLATLAGGNLLASGIQMAIGAITNFISGSNAAYAEAEQNQAQLGAVLKSTGEVAGRSKDQLNNMAQSLMNLTGIDDDVITKSEALLLTFTKVRGKIFDEALPAILDLSAALGQDLQKSTIQVGKALNDPIAGLTALKKAGVSFTQDQKEMIKTMQAAGNIVGAQKIILSELTKEFGGVAEAISNTESGALVRFNTRMGNIQETIGGFITRLKSGSAAASGGFMNALEALTNKLFDGKSAAQSLSDEFEKQKGEVKGLQTNIDPLLTRYDQLKAKGKLNKDEQADLNKILNTISTTIPGAITQWDKYGNALDMNTTKAREYIKIQQLLLKQTNKSAIEAEKAALKDNEIQRESLRQQLLTGKTEVTSSGGDGIAGMAGIQTTAAFKLSNEELIQVKMKLVGVNKDIEEGELRLKGLTGDYMNAKPVVTPPPPPDAGTGDGGKAAKEAAAKAKRYAAETLRINESLNKEMDKLGIAELQSTMSKNQKELDDEARKYDTLISGKEAYLKRDKLSEADKQAATAAIAKLHADKTTALNAMAVNQEADMMQKIADLREKLAGKIETELDKETALINKSYDDQEASFQGNQPRLDQLKLERAKDLSDAELREQERLEKEKQRIESEYALLTGDKNTIALAEINKKYDDELVALKKSFSDKLIATNEYKDAEAAIEKNRNAAVAKKQSEIDAETQAQKDDEDKQKKDAALASAQAVSDAVFEIGKNNRQRETDIALSAIEKQRTTELSKKNLTEKQKAAINKKFDDEAKAIKLKQWKADKVAAIEQAIINGALAVIKALPNIPLAIASGVAAASQLAVIIASKPPEFAKGVRNFEGGAALVGEEGMEAIEENGKLWLATKPTITNLSPGANVYTAEETSKMMNGSLGNKLYQPTSYSVDYDSARKAEMQYRSPVSAPAFTAPSVSSTESTKAPAQSDELKTMQKTLSTFMETQAKINERPVTLNYRAFEEFKKLNIDDVRIKQGV
jgi:hypothetical protein